MAKTTITRTCGHTETVNICGPYKDRARQAEYEATRTCRECYLAGQEASRNQAAAEAAESAAANGLPALQGSEKQVRWAEQVRAELLTGADAIRDRLSNAPNETHRAAVADALAAIEAETAAGWWIDNRAVSLLDLVAAAARKALQS